MNVTTTRPPMDDVVVPPPKVSVVRSLGLVRARRKHSTDPAIGRPWWLWPHLLSLDAPLVALVWQRWWAFLTHTPLLPPQEIVLFLGVWFIYLADRLADTRHCAQADPDTDRHVFYSVYRAHLLPLAAFALVALSIGTPICLDNSQFLSGLGLASFTGGYFWLVHGGPQSRWTVYLPKEAVVGMMFSTGTGFFVLCASHSLPTDFFMSLTLFAVLCFLNCALIAKWERSRQDLCAPVSLLNAFPRMTSHLRVGCLLLMGLSLVTAAATHAQASLPVALSALLLALLDGWRASLSARSLHLLADAALLTPCFWLALPVGTHPH